MAGTLCHKWYDIYHNHLQVLKLEHQNLRQESLEYKNCVLDATEKSKTIQQYGMLVLSTFFSFLIYFHLLEMIVT